MPLLSFVSFYRTIERHSHTVEGQIIFDKIQLAHPHK